MADYLNAAFFASVRSLFAGSLSQDQVDGITTICEAWDRMVGKDDRQLAYLLATSKHETANTMQPVRETLASTDAQAVARLDAAWKAGKLGSVKTPYWRDGWFGRGYVQLTHEDNYRKAGTKLGINLVGNPSLAMKPDTAARILIRGSLEGWFTTKKLGDYITATKTDYINARRVVNGSDRASLIAGYATSFETAILAGRSASDGVMPKPDLTVNLPTGRQTVHVPDGPQTHGRLIASIIAVVLAIGSGLLKLIGVN